jgi:hypothetical protein
MTEERAPRQVTIRNAVIHLNNEQPLLADLFDVPAPGDLGLLCTNLRTMNGKRPVFADHMASTFFFPYQHIRFLEIQPPPDAAPMLDAPAGQPAVASDELEADLEIDEDFLKRIRDV